MVTMSYATFPTKMEPSEFVKNEAVYSCFDAFKCYLERLSVAITLLYASDIRLTARNDVFALRSRS